MRICENCWRGKDFDRSGTNWFRRVFTYGANICWKTINICITNLYAWFFQHWIFLIHKSFNQLVTSFAFLWNWTSFHSQIIYCIGFQNLWGLICVSYNWDNLGQFVNLIFYHLSLNWNYQIIDIDMFFSFFFKKD